MEGGGKQRKLYRTKLQTHDLLLPTKFRLKVSVPQHHQVRDKRLIHDLVGTLHSETLTERRGAPRGKELAGRFPLDVRKGTLPCRKAGPASGAARQLVGSGLGMRNNTVT